MHAKFELAQAQQDIREVAAQLAQACKALEDSRKMLIRDNKHVGARSQFFMMADSHNFIERYSRIVADRRARMGQLQRIITEAEAALAA